MLCLVYSTLVLLNIQLNMTFYETLLYFPLPPLHVHLSVTQLTFTEAK